MKTSTDFYAGLTTLQLPPDQDEYDLGHGLVLRRTYAHLMGSYTMAFNPPAAPGKHHPAPWKATTRHDGFDVHTELVIPSGYKPPGDLTPYDAARTLTSVLRLCVDPTIRFLVQSSHSLSEVAAIPDREIRLTPVESTQQYIQLALIRPEPVIGSLGWVREYWSNAVSLMAAHADFRLAMEAFELSMFVPHHALTLVSLWGALEALFSPSTSELRFRVSVLIASYVHPPGEERLALQREIFELYDKRSAAAHGKPKHNTSHLVQTFNILQRVLVRMIEENEVPNKIALNNMLLGAP
ncbi:HEPN domain-containing protein [Paraburkholderia nemoris]|uniref:HEPN domain-containing protein n=1 Tax=Paraburkholderia nemoris TaxID=2793076 RepID=UPI001B1DFEBA|nr:HEPN domain-containing protein [Paraburkholderia nemoris]CAE6792143.1 hypothetical protein LMG22931_05005 [Paraburkholderia nemoris]